MSSIEKTGKLQRVDLPIDQLVANDFNPNQMDDATFNILSDNVERTGITDAILVRKLADEQYRIVGGHHRWEVAKLHGFATVPCTVIDDPEFDDDAEKFQVVRMNVIHGSMSPQKFIKLYESLSEKYTDEVAAEMFGFVEEETFKKLKNQMKAALPKEMQKDFDKAAKEIKTIDGLTKLLNDMINTHGDTLPCGFMVVDFGGKESLWLRMEPKTRKAFEVLGKRLVTEQRSADAIIGGLVRLAGEGKLETQLVQLIADSEPVEIPDGFDVIPTQQALEAEE